MSAQFIVQSADALQAWSRDPDAARDNLRTIFAGLKHDESISEWAAEALENCGPPHESDLDFLQQATAELECNTAYWACKLIGRLGSKSNSLQDVLVSVLLSEKASLATHQQAALALASIGKLTTATRKALEQTTNSTDPRLARISTQALGSES